MNTLRLHALTSAHVDTLKRALRIAIRHDRQTLSIERARMTQASIEQAKAHIRAMEQLADGLSPSTPPSLPMVYAPGPESEFRCPYCGPRDTPTPAAGIPAEPVTDCGWPNAMEGRAPIPYPKD